MYIIFLFIYISLLLINGQQFYQKFPQEIQIEKTKIEKQLDENKKIINNNNLIIEKTKKCVKRYFSADSFVCVCNKTFCDQPEQIGRFTKDNAFAFQTDLKEQRLNRKELKIMLKTKKKCKSSIENEVKIKINASRQYQKIHGFGGAFTDAVGYNLNLLSKKTHIQLLRTYFDKNIGIRYTVGRVPIASCDFSTRVYSYCDTINDFKLKTFALAKEDLYMKIPHILTANILSGSTLRLFASPWSAPAWMKTSGKMPGGGSLKGKLEGPYYHTYAQYLKRFFEEYALLGNISFWGMTLENEPQYGLDPGYLFQAMWLSPENQRDFANNILSPILKTSLATKNLLIMAHDDDRSIILDAAKRIFGNKNNISTKSSSNNNIISGLAYHWYSFCSHSVLSDIHNLYPDKFIFGTEACAGWTGNDRGVSLGNWTRGMMYGRDILRGLQNWAIGWTDWNLCLDLIGGPNWVKNYVDSPIIVNITADEFYKQPMFYAMAHFSRFIPPGSVRIDSQISSKFSKTNQIESVAFRTPHDGNRVLVLISNSEENIKGIIEEEEIKKDGKIRTIYLNIPPNSFTTIIWPKNK